MINNIFEEKEQVKPGVDSTMLPELKVKGVSDSDLLKMTDQFINKGVKFNQVTKQRYDDNKSYYTGEKFSNYKIQDNRIFTSIETIIPIATSGQPVPNALPAQDTLKSKKLANQWEKILSSVYNKQGMQRKTEKSLRHLNMASFTVFKTYWCEDEKMIKTRVVHPKRIMLDNEVDVDDGIPWIAELITEPASEIAKKFPEKKREIEELVRKDMGTKITYYEIWTNELVIYRLPGKVILRAVRNPNYSWENDKNNFQKKARHPYFILNMFDLGESVTSPTTLIEQNKGLQEDINKRKNQIATNADIVNGKIIATGQNGLKKSEVASIDWTDPKQGVHIEKGEITDIQRVSGSPLPQFVENDMMLSQQSIDNVMGTHSTTRGEREGRETAAGRAILRESDRGRIDVLGRRYEEMFQEMFNYWVQLIRVWVEKPINIRVLSEDNAKEFIKIDRDGIQDGMEIEVITGSFIPEDKASKQNRTMTAASAGMIDPITFYKDMGYRNPEEKAKNLFLWQSDPKRLFADLEEEDQEVVAESTERQISKAKEETEILQTSEKVPPFKKADGNHIAFHEEFIDSPQFANLDQTAQQNYIEHVKQELDIVSAQAKEAKE